MIVLVTGGSGCGKSTWAERLIAALPEERRVYVATMRVCDGESVQRVARHRAQRAHLGFATIECEKDLAAAEIPQGSVVLLEDLVNLAANEMFSGGDVSRVVPALNHLARRCSHLVMASSTYNGDIFTPMENILTDLKAHNFQNRTVAVIDNGSWAATAGKQMRELVGTMKNMTVLENSVSLKSSVKEAQRTELEALADALAAELLG